MPALPLPTPAWWLRVHVHVRRAQRVPIMHPAATLVTLELVHASLQPSAPAAARLLPSPSELLGRISFREDEALDTPFHVEAMAACLVACLQALGRGLGLDVGDSHTAPIDANHAGLLLRGDRHMRVDGKPVELWDPFSGLYATRDGSLAQVHTNFPHHREAVFRALGLPLDTRDRDVVEQAVREKMPSGVHLEEAVLGCGGAAAAVRACPATPSPQTSRMRLIEIARDTGPGRGAPPRRPIRVLDHTRVLAGASVTQLLCSMGCDVIGLTSPSNLPQIESMRLLNGKGKRFVEANLKADPDAANDLADTADVYVSSFRPGLGVASRLAAKVAVSCFVQAYDFLGPWRNRRGFDSLVQCATGLVAMQTQWSGGKPGHLPVQALDWGAGMLGCIGVLAVLIQQRADHGGQWTVRISLERVATLLRDDLPLRTRAHVPNGSRGVDALSARVGLRSVPIDDGRVMSFVPGFFDSNTSSRNHVVQGSQVGGQRAWRARL